MPNIDRPIMKNITLLQRFSILSLISLLFISVSLGWIITYILEQDILLRSRELTAKIVSEEAGKEFPLAELVTPKISDYDEFSEKLKHLTFGPDIVRMKLWNKEMVVVWSDDPSTQHIPVIMVTALDDEESRIKGLEAGANDFLSKPVNNAELMVRARNLLKVKEFEDFLSDYNKILADEVAEKTRELRSSYIDTIYRLTLAAEYKDNDTASHIRRISLYTALRSRRPYKPAFDHEKVYKMRLLQNSLIVSFRTK